MKKIISALLSFALVLSLFTGFVPATVEAATIPNGANLKNTYTSLFGHAGTCVTPYQWNDGSVRNFIKGEYNSITMENEMKPDAVLRQNTISVAQAKNQGYYIPDSYKESTVPSLNFSTIDSMMKNAYDNGLQIRYHTLVWHAQTPDWYFRSGYSSNGGYVNQQTMDARLEFYIKSVMGHICSSNYANVVYCYDVVNEYLHANPNSGWIKIYGGVSTTPSFVKKAFQYAYETLEYFKMNNSVSLFYNDYNTYMEVDKIISMINWINREKKICSGIGMQSHLSSSFPSASYYQAALDKFAAQRYEIQITELDAGGNGDTDQANYLYGIMSAICKTKKNGGNITAVIWWGLHDGASWRGSDKPLLFSSLGVKKQSYNATLQAYFDAGFQMNQTGGNTPVNPTQQPTSTPVSITSTNKVPNGTYYIKNVNAQKYIQVKDNTGANAQNVELGTGTGAAGQRWKVKHNSDGTVEIVSALGAYSLDIANGADENGANVQIYSSWGGDAQKFYILETSTNGVYTIATKASNGTKNIDVYEKKTADGTNIIQWQSTNGTNQQFVFEPVSNVTPTTQAPATQTPATQGPATSGVTCEYKVVSDWGSSWQGEIVITNKSGSTLNGWTFTCDYNSKIDNLWGAEFVGQSGTKVTVKNPSWDAQLANGQSVTINFIANGTDKSAPTNMSVR
ncbi:MAG: endo-1,4-beta-xylanase [Clostridium sp.]|nr:endo-1,4-beta-xylanase [Clostridium sp.]